MEDRDKRENNFLRERGGGGEKWIDLAARVTSDRRTFRTKTLFLIQPQEVKIAISRRLQ